MMNWIWQPVDLGIIREATPAGQPAIPGLRRGEDRRAVRGGGR